MAPEVQKRRKSKQISESSMVPAKKMKRLGSGTVPQATDKAVSADAKKPVEFPVHFETSYQLTAAFNAASDNQVKRIQVISKWNEQMAVFDRFYYAPLQKNCDNMTWTDKQEICLKIAQQYLISTPTADALVDTWKCLQNEQTTNERAEHIEICMMTLARLLEMSRWMQAPQSTVKLLARCLLQEDLLKFTYKNIASASKLIGCSVRLWRALNSIGPAITKELHEKFNFSFKNLQKLFGDRRNGVRPNFIRFLLGFFVHGSTSVKKDVLQVADLITGIFRGLSRDSTDMIKYVLNTVYDKILLDYDLSRRSKIGLLNNTVLQQLIGIYEAQDVASVNALHEFLMKTCCNPGSGICFESEAWFTNEIHNKILLNLLADLKPLEDPLQMELVIKILSTSSDLIPPFWTRQTMQLEPRIDERWLLWMNMVLQIIRIDPPPLKSIDEHSLKLTHDFNQLPVFLSNMQQHVLPSCLTRLVISKGLQHQNLYINYITAVTTLASFEKLEKVTMLFENDARIVPQELEWKRVRHSLISELKKRLPDFQVIISTYKRVSEVKMPLEDDMNDDNDDFARFSDVQLVQVALLKLMRHYVVFLQDKWDDLRFDFGKLLNFPDLQGRSDFLLELTVFDLLTEVPFQWNSKSEVASTHLLYLLQYYIRILNKNCNSDDSHLSLRERTKEFIVHMMATTHAFKYRQDEIGIWLNTLESLPPYAQEQVASLVEFCCLDVQRNLMKYADSYTAFMTEILSMSSEDSTVSNFKDWLMVKQNSQTPMLVFSYGLMALHQKLNWYSSSLDEQNSQFEITLDFFSRLNTRILLVHPITTLLLRNYSLSLSKYAQNTKLDWSILQNAVTNWNHLTQNRNPMDAESVTLTLHQVLEQIGSNILSSGYDWKSIIASEIEDTPSIHQAQLICKLTLNLCEFGLLDSQTCFNFLNRIVEKFESLLECVINHPLMINSILSNSDQALRNFSLKSIKFSDKSDDIIQLMIDRVKSLPEEKNLIKNLSQVVVSMSKGHIVEILTLIESQIEFEPEFFELLAQAIQKNNMKAEFIARSNIQCFAKALIVGHLLEKTTNDETLLVTVLEYTLKELISCGNSGHTLILLRLLPSVWTFLNRHPELESSEFAKIQDICHHGFQYLSKTIETRKLKLSGQLEFILKLMECFAEQGEEPSESFLVAVFEEISRDFVSSAIHLEKFGIFLNGRQSTISLERVLTHIARLQQREMLPEIDLHISFSIEFCRTHFNEDKSQEIWKFIVFILQRIGTWVQQKGKDQDSDEWKEHPSYFRATGKFLSALLLNEQNVHLANECIDTFKSVFKIILKYRLTDALLLDIARQIFLLIQRSDTKLDPSGVFVMILGHSAFQKVAMPPHQAASQFKSDFSVDPDPVSCPLLVPCPDASDQKRSLAALMLACCESAGSESFLTSQHLKLFMSMYTATTLAYDQIMEQLILLAEEQTGMTLLASLTNGADWGWTRVCPPSFTVKKGMDLTSWLETIDSRWMMESVRHFSPRLRLKCTEEQVRRTITEIPDPTTTHLVPHLSVRFWMTYFANIVLGAIPDESQWKLQLPLDPSWLDIQAFINARPLELSLVCLASDDPTLRRMASLVLNKIYRILSVADILKERTYVPETKSKKALKTQRYLTKSTGFVTTRMVCQHLAYPVREKKCILMLLHLVRHSHTQVNPETEPRSRMPTLFAQFLAHAIQILQQPGHDLYVRLNSFLLGRPQLDLTDIPLLYECLFATGSTPSEPSTTTTSLSTTTSTMTHRHRQWLLKIILYGSWDQRDGRLWLRRHLLELLMSLAYHGLTRDDPARRSHTRFVRGFIMEVMERFVYRCLDLGHGTDGNGRVPSVEAGMTWLMAGVVTFLDSLSPFASESASNLSSAAGASLNESGISTLAEGWTVERYDALRRALRQTQPYWSRHHKNMASEENSQQQRECQSELVNEIMTESESESESETEQSESETETEESESESSSSSSESSSESSSANSSESESESD